jgi:peptidoglycan/xylan/chitin deacetylase (PgdA/CDA1 family)
MEGFMKNLFMVFLFFIVLLLSCGSENGGIIGLEELDTTQYDTTNYPTPDKLCALTFDDGPDAGKTPLVLDKLEYYEVVATFFVIGQKMNSNTKPVLEREVSMGCEIGNHSYGWGSMTSMTTEEIQTSVFKTDSLVEEYAGVIPNFFRPPNLLKNNTMFESIDLPFASGVTGCDWDGCNNTPQEVAEDVLAGMRDGAIILLHDVQETVPADSHPTPAALDTLIPALKNLGYEFVTLSNLFDRKGIDPDVEYKMWKYLE